jgi:protease IV
MLWTRKRKVFTIVVSIVVLIFLASFIKHYKKSSAGDQIGVVEIEGVISDGKDTMDEIIKFKEDDSIKAVILRIDSPGGSVGPSQEIYREVQKLREKKKVWVSMGTTCASGGYYIAAAADKLYANPSTITGSIGVIMQLMIAEDLLKKLGLQSNTIKAGKFKDAGSPFRAMTEQEKEYINQVVMSIYDQFIKDVALSRKMDAEKVRALAEGRVYTGTQAKDAGLVDAIGNFYDTVDMLGAELKIKGKPSLVYVEKPFSLPRWLLGAVSKDFSKELAGRLTASPFKFLMTP